MKSLNHVTKVSNMVFKSLFAVVKAWYNIFQTIWRLKLKVGTPKQSFINWHISLVLKNKLFGLIYQLHQFPKGDLNSRPQLTFTFLLSDQRLRPLRHSASLSKFWLKLWELKYVYEHFIVKLIHMAQIVLSV